MMPSLFAIVPTVPEGYEAASSKQSLLELPDETFFVLKTNISFKAKEYKNCLMGDCVDGSDGYYTHKDYTQLLLNLSPVTSSNARIISKDKVFILSKMECEFQYVVDSDVLKIYLRSTDKKTELILNVKIKEADKNNRCKHHAISDLNAWFDVYVPPVSVIK